MQAGYRCKYRAPASDLGDTFDCGLARKELPTWAQASGWHDRLSFSYNDTPRSVYDGFHWLCWLPARQFEGKAEDMAAAMQQPILQLRRDRGICPPAATQPLARGPQARLAGCALLVATVLGWGNR